MPDHRKEFFLDDNHELGPEVFYAINHFEGLRNALKNRMSAIAVRERGTDNFAKIFRLMHSVPPRLQE